MKKTLAIALAFAAMVTTAIAQQTIEPYSLPLVDRSATVGEPTHTPTLGRAAAEQAYRWYSRVLTRYGRTGDSNRLDLTVPLDLGGVEMRGFGQILPGPLHLYSLFSAKAFTANGQSIYTIDTSFENDEEYVNQFKNATKYSVEGFSMPFFKNPYGPSQNPGLITLYKTKFNFRSNAYKQNGFSSGRSTLTKIREIEINSDGIDSTIMTNDQGDTVVNTSEFVFQDEPIQLNADESLIVLYTNEFAPVVTQPVPAYDSREFQRVIGTMEYREGDVYEDPDNPGTTIDDRRNPIDSFLCFGLVMFRENNKDSIYSAWRGLVFGTAPNQKRAIVNLNMTFIGTADLNSGVKYHFGRDAENQGIGSITPNPVRTNTSIPFSLVRASSVKIDLFDSRGELVKTLVDSRYGKGLYSVDLSTEGMENGVYMVRMVANDNVYTSKISVSR